MIRVSQSTNPLQPKINLVDPLISIYRVFLKKSAFLGNLNFWHFVFTIQKRLICQTSNLGSKEYT